MLRLRQGTMFFPVREWLQARWVYSNSMWIWSRWDDVCKKSHATDLLTLELPQAYWWPNFIVLSSNYSWVYAFWPLTTCETPTIVYWKEIWRHSGGYSCARISGHWSSVVLYDCHCLPLLFRILIHIKTSMFPRINHIAGDTAIYLSLYIVPCSPA